MPSIAGAIQQKFAVTERIELVTTVQVEVVPLQVPPQPTRDWPGSGVAVSVIEVSAP